MNLQEMWQGALAQLRAQTAAQRALRGLLALTMLTALVLTVLPAWNVVLVGMGVAIIGAVLTVVLPNSVTPFVFLVGILVNWVMRSSGELGWHAVALGGCLVVFLLSLISCTLAPADTRLPARVWRRLGVAGIVGCAVWAGTCALVYLLVSIEVPGLMPLALLAVLLVPIAAWLLLRPQPVERTPQTQS